MLVTWPMSQGLNAGLSFWLPFDDLGSGVVNLVPNSCAGDGTPTFTRATTATTILSNGLIGSVSSGVARSCYSPAGVYLGYLAEEARTNLCLQSGDIGTTWAATAATVGTATTGPDGTASAKKLQEDNTTAQHYVQQNFTKAASALAYTLSAYCKQAERTWALIQAFDASSNGAQVWVNLATGALGTTSAFGGTAFTSVSSTIQAAANGFYHIALTFTTTTATTLDARILTSTGDGVSSYTGTTGSGIYAWGAQLEQAAFATSYIPTTTVAVTKNIDRDAYAVSGNLTTGDFSIALQWTPSAAGQGTKFLWGSYVDASNYTAILHDGTNLIFRKRISGTNHDATIALSYVAGTTYKIAVRASSAGLDIWLNGTKGTNDTTTTAAQLGSTFEIGNDGNGGSAMCGSYMQDRQWTRALADSQLVAMTS